MIFLHLIRSIVIFSSTSNIYKSCLTVSLHVFLDLPAFLYYDIYIVREQRITVISFILVLNSHQYMRYLLYYNTLRQYIINVYDKCEIFSLSIKYLSNY